ncbi:hypothetical protein CRG98_001478 [Punica granatum]|uniref:CCHC-type domain-containing protein n=1 Tax=Punica granatum TaxID=22663 RepID=A0A2I0LBT8_PUNGR|nr:hypothetical protein CRG98_001478 [Punica granatum]
MPPRRREHGDDIYDRDNLRHLEQRLEQIVDERMDRSSSGANRSEGGDSSSRANRPRGGANRNTANTSQLNRPTGNGVRCFECGEVGHRQSEYKKAAGEKTFFVDTEEGDEEDVEESEDPIFDCEEVIDEEVVT